MRRKGVWVTIAAILICLGIADVASATVFIQHDQESYELHEKMRIFEDTEGTLSIDEVSSLEFSDKFQTHNGGVPSYGYRTSVFWVRFEIENQSPMNEFVLEFPYAPHDSIILYENNGSDKYTASYGGDLLPFSERDRDNRHVTYNLTLQEKESYTYYVRFESEGSLQLSVILWEERAFTEKSLKEYLLFGLYFGATLMMVIYNVFLYFSLRFRSYLWYVIFIIGVSVTQITLHGFAYQFFWPESPWWNNRSIVFSMALTSFAAALFVDKFLDVRNFAPKLSRFINLLASINIAIMGVVLLRYDLALNLVMLASVLMIFTVMATTILCWKRGNISARYLFLGWFIFLFCALLLSLSDSGMIPVNSFTRYGTIIGSVIEMLLFSLALADQVKMFQRDKERAERTALENKETTLEQLKRADRLKDEFLANTTHELRTPLYGMIGIAESLRDGVAGEPNAILKYNLSLIINSGQRLSNLLNDLLDYSKLKFHELVLDIGPVRLRDAANVVMTIIGPLTKNKEVQLVNRISPDLPYAKADENRIQQILYNLIGNAVKFTDMGSVTIEADIGRNNELVVKIVDTGIGMSKEDLNIAFNEFEQGVHARKKQEIGTGLGLSITKDLVQLHGGRIFLSSDLGEGTTVGFTLPIYQEPVKKPPSISPYYERTQIEQATEGSVSPTNYKIKGRILIADDDLVNIQVLSNHLTLNGYELVVAHDGEEVLTIIREGATFDLIILDLMMPKLSGYEVCKEIRADFSLTELPILILTAQSRLKDVVTAFQAGANDYLIKPYFKEELLARVETLLTLKKVMEEVMEKSRELSELNRQLYALNDELEERVQNRTKELELKTEKLIKMEKSRRYLLSTISHDLATPMTSIQGYIKAMLDGLIDPSNLRYADIIYEKTLFIARLIKDLHDLSRLETGQANFHMDWITVHEFIYGFLQGFETDIIANNILFKLDSCVSIEKAQLRLNIDLDRIRQVMENLISNAIKYTNENGTITIEAIFCDDYFTRHNEKQKYVEEIAASLEDKVENGKSLIIAVHDNGKGIDSESLPFIFDRFYRGDSENYDSYRNAGLGLAIAKEIIDFHNGIMWAESIHTKGSSFYFTLPIYTVEAGTC